MTAKVSTNILIMLWHVIIIIILHIRPIPHDVLLHSKLTLQGHLRSDTNSKIQFNCQYVTS